MASTGPNSPSTVVDDSTLGTTAWSSPGNATTSDNVYATVLASGTGASDPHGLKATGFGFSIPTNATVLGVTIEVERNASAASQAIDGAVRLVKGGVVGSTDRSNGTGVTWPTTDAYATYGSSSDLWGTTITPSDVNGSTFGAFFQGKANAAGSGGVGLSVDHIRITVSYLISHSLSTLGVGA